MELGPFEHALKVEILANLNNKFDDNLDGVRFGKRSFVKRAVVWMKDLLLRRWIMGPLFRSAFVYRKLFLGTLGKVYKIQQKMSGLEFFYSVLANDASKELLVKLIAYRILGYRKVRLPLSSPAYWQGIKQLQDHSKPTEILNGYVQLVDMHVTGYPLELLFTPKGAYTTFVVEQYKYAAENKSIEVNPGETVLDLGGCYGDTALYFSHKLGASGKVYSFEFIPSNLDVLNQNLAMNTALSPKIDVVTNPVWETSGNKVYYKDEGAGSQVKFEQFEGYEGETVSLSIDDFVTERQLSRLDFIKMDIEGAEPFALRGAKNSILKFKPRLAISIYHSMDDFVNIVKYVDSLQAGYRFYLGHSTIYTSETVLFAVVEP